MDFEEQRKAFQADVGWDLAMWRVAMIPQLLFLLIIAILFAATSIFGVVFSFYHYNDVSDVNNLKKSLPIFIGGSSSLLGVPLFKVLPLLSKRAEIYLHGERTYTAFFAKTRQATTTKELGTVIEAYRKLSM